MLLLDNSAWSRLLLGVVPEERAEAVVAQIDKGEVATCLPFLLEAGYSARSATDHLRIVDRLSRLPEVAIDRRVEARALQAQRELASVSHHRLAPIDILIAACADEAGAGVLHYDLIAEHTGLRFESIWLAPAGTL